MSRLREISVQTNIKDDVDMLTADIPLNDDVEFSKYVKDCHRVLYQLLRAHKIKNPNVRNRYLNVSESRLLTLRSAWENYLFDYYSSLVNSITVGKHSLSPHTLMWRNFCVLNAVIINRRHSDAFPYSSARNIKYVRKNLLCISDKPIGDYSMSELLKAMRVLSARKWQLPWSQSYINYILQLEFAAAERVTWLGDKQLYDEGCRGVSEGRYGVTLDCSAYMAEWFYHQKRRIRERMLLKEWLDAAGEEGLVIDQTALQRLHVFLSSRAEGLHDPSRFLRPLKSFVLRCCVREGEMEKYKSKFGSKSASVKDILREFRPVNYISYREDTQFDVSSLRELLQPSSACMREYRQLTLLYLINLVFQTTEGCRFDWMRFYVCFERDFNSVYDAIKSSDQPLVLQSFNSWYIYYQGRAWWAGDIASAFIGWMQLIRDHLDCKMHHSVNIAPLIDELFPAPQLPLLHINGSDESEDDMQLELNDVSEWL